MKCPRCEKAELVVIQMQMAGEAVALHSCSRCDIRWWEKGADPIPLAKVLGLASSRD
jgi:hypothetical protein